jgi:hypothetical protein
VCSPLKLCYFDTQNLIHIYTCTMNHTHLIIASQISNNNNNNIPALESQMKEERWKNSFTGTANERGREKNNKILWRKKPEWRLFGMKEKRLLYTCTWFSLAFMFISPLHKQAHVVKVMACDCVWGKREQSSLYVAHQNEMAKGEAKDLLIFIHFLQFNIDREFV